MDSKLFESIITFGEAPKPGFDCKGGLIGLDGKFKKFYKPDMTYDMKDDHIVHIENIMPNRLETWSTKAY